MMSMATQQTESALGRGRSTAALAVPGVLAFTVPFVGFVASLLLPFLAARHRSRLWPGTSPAKGHLAGALVVTGLWLNALLAVVSLGRLGSDATTWLLLPLCAPAGAALVVPAALAVVAYLTGLTVGVVLRTPWPWVVGAWAAPLVYSGASRWLVDFACIA